MIIIILYNIMIYYTYNKLLNALNCDQRYGHRTWNVLKINPINI